MDIASQTGWSPGGNGWQIGCVGQSEYPRLLRASESFSREIKRLGTSSTGLNFLEDNYNRKRRGVVKQACRATIAFQRANRTATIETAIHSRTMGRAVGVGVGELVLGRCGRRDPWSLGEVVKGW